MNLRSVCVASLAACGLFFAPNLIGRAGDGSAVQPASADEPRAVLPRFSYPVRFLLNDPRVQAELQLSDECRTAIRAMTGEHLLNESDHRALLEWWLQQSLAIDDEDADEAAVRRREIARHFEQQRKRTEALERSLLDRIKGAQRKRLEQISLQLAGAPALVWPETVRTLDLSDEQTAKLQEVRVETSLAGKALHDALKAGRVTNAEVPMRRVELWRKSLEESLAVLSDAQRERYRELCGVPIPFGPQDLRRELRFTARDLARDQR